MAYYRLGFGKSKDADNVSPTRNTVQVDQAHLLAITEKICADKKCPDALLAMRIVLHVFAGAEISEQIETGANQLAKELGLPQASVENCLSYLQGISAIPAKKSTND